MAAGYNGKLILIDGNSLAHRAYWALPALRATDGTPTGAVHGFMTMLLRLLAEQRPTHLAVAFDRAEPTFRHVEYEGYKAQRGGSPDDFRVQVPLLKQILSGLGVAICEKEGYEADDVLGCLAREGARQGVDVVVVTGDRDALQLVDDRIRVMLTRKGITELVVYDEEALQRDFGISAGQVPDVKGLMGDASDNIPGVPGIGEKIAYRLIQRWGSLENVLDHAEEVAESKRVREALANYREQALLSKRLATICPDVPLDMDLRSCRWHPPDPAPLESLFARLELRRLWEHLTKTLPSGTRAAAEAALAGPGEELRVVEDAADLEEAFRYLRSGLDLRQQKDGGVDSAPGPVLGISFHLEGDRPQRSELAGLAVSSRGRCLYVAGSVPWTHLRRFLLPLLEDDSVQKSGHDLKPFLVWLLRQEGKAALAPAFDSLLAAYLLDPTRSSYPLSLLAREYLGWEIPAEDVFGRGGRRATPFTTVTTGQAASFLGGRARASRELVVPLRAELEAGGLARLMDEAEMPLLPVLAHMEHAGVRVDLARVAELADEFGRQIEAVAEEIYSLAGYVFNINSTHQLQEVLFCKLGLPAKHKTKTGFSTSAEALEELRSLHPIVEKILAHRTLVKLKGTYLDGMPALVDQSTGRVHTTFNQAVTATGRLSSNDPNLQNIPVRDDLGRRIRQAFVPAEGCLFLSGDYSQIELRLLAHVSQDPNLLEAFCTGQDIHRRTAAEVFGVPLDQVTGEMRSRAKAVNFGIVYGISDFGLAQQLGISRGEAREYITSYFFRYGGVRKWVDETLDQARSLGYVTTLLGRRRPVPGILSRNPQERGFAERTAVNTPLQGSAADIIKLAMVRLHRELSEAGLTSRLLLQVHDELILEVPRSELAAVAGLVKTAMEGVFPLAVPLQVDLRAGPSWYDLSPM